MLLALEDLEDIRDSLAFYFNLGLDDKKICEHLKDHYDTDIYKYIQPQVCRRSLQNEVRKNAECQTIYIISVVSLQCLLNKWGFEQTHKQIHTFESIAKNVRGIQK